MLYRAVGNSCAFNLANFELNEEETLSILEDKGFRVIKLDVVSTARECVGKSKYKRGARPSEAPAVVDCSSFTKWVYGQRGIWLPRRSIQQAGYGIGVSFKNLRAGDLVFVSGFIDRYHRDPSWGIGHVGIFSGENTLIHAANTHENVTETPIEKFTDSGKKWRGARRYIPEGEHIVTLATPTRREVETSDDIKWIIRSSLPPPTQPERRSHEHNPD